MSNNHTEEGEVMLIEQCPSEYVHFKYYLIPYLSFVICYLSLPFPYHTYIELERTNHLNIPFEYLIKIS